MKKIKNVLFQNRKIINATLFLIFSLLFLIEISLRIFLPDHLLDKRSIIPNQLYYKAYKQNNTFTTTSSKFDDFQPVLNKINSIGIRGPEINKKFSYRILNIGDSYVQADEIEYENTFGYKLNDHLNLEFISHGISSWSPTTEFSWIYRNYESLQIDEINLFICVNDFFTIKNNTHTKGDEYYRSKANYSSESIPVSYNLNNDNFFKKNLKKLYIIKSLLIFKDLIIPEVFISDEQINSLPNYQLNSKVSQIELYESSVNWTNDQKKGIFETLSVIKIMNDFFLKNDIKFNLVFVPNFYYWKDEVIKYKLESDALDLILDYNVGIENFIRNYAKKNKINNIDLTKKFINFKNLNPEKKLFFDWDGHWNNNGHNLVFEVLKDYYLSTDFTLPPSVK